MLQTQLTKSFAEAKERIEFSILSLIPPIIGHGDKPEDSSLHDVDFLLGETLENLTKVDKTININATVLPQMGLFICANTVLHCHTFVQVQSTSPAIDSAHPTPFLFNAAMRLGDIITSQPLQDTILGHSKQTLLVSYTDLACLDTITMCFGKEASNLDMLWNARHDIGCAPNMFDLPQPTEP